MLGFCVLVLGGCATTNKLPVDDPRAMIEHYSYWIENQCDILVGRVDPKGREECRRKQSHDLLYNQYQSYQGQYGNFALNRVWDIYFGRCEEYFKLGEYHNSILDCRKALQVGKWTDYVTRDVAEIKPIHLLALSYFHIGKYRSAVAALNQLKKMNGDCPNTGVPTLLDNLDKVLKKEQWEDCIWITKNIVLFEQRLSNAVAEHNENLRKHEAYKREMEKIEEERLAKQYEQERVERKRQRKLEKAREDRVTAERQKRLRQFLENQKLACERSKNLEISQVFWENIANQYGLDPRSKRYDLVDVSSSGWLSGAIALAIPGSETPDFLCTVKIYLDNGVCVANATIVKNDNRPGLFSPFEGSHVLHNGTGLPCKP